MHSENPRTVQTLTPYLIRYFYSCGLSTATIEYSCPSVMSVCVCVCVCLCTR